MIGPHDGLDGGTPPQGAIADGPSTGGSPVGALLASAVITLGGIALFMVLIAGTRRRRLTAVLAAVSAAEAPVATSSAAARAVAPPIVPPDTPFDEAEIPRWRRPSLRAARQLSERDVPLEHVPLVFTGAPRTGEDRRQVVYRLVRVSTEPDEFLGQEIARVDRGDEVEVLREQAGYCLIRTPLGAVGWVHRTTLRREEDEASFEIRLRTND